MLTGGGDDGSCASVLSGPSADWAVGMDFYADPDPRWYAAPDSCFGVSATEGADLTGDGLADLAVGAPACWRGDPSAV